MIAYVSFVAITNLMLGMLLARVLAPNDAPTLRPAKARDRRSTPVADECERPLPQSELVATPAEPVPLEPAPTEEPLPEPALPPSPQPRTAAPLKSWGEFARQLRDIKDRTYYCRTAQDARLARQAAEQLRACGIEWYAQFEKCLRGEQLDEATQALVAGKSVGAVEMFAAQIETTLSNIDALDFTASVDDILVALERELEMLDSQQKSVAKSHEDVNAN